MHRKVQVGYEADEAMMAGATNGSLSNGLEPEVWRLPGGTTILGDHSFDFPSPPPCFRLRFPTSSIGRLLKNLELGLGEGARADTCNFLTFFL